MERRDVAKAVGSVSVDSGGVRVIDAIAGWQEDVEASNKSSMTGEQVRHTVNDGSSVNAREFVSMLVRRGIGYRYWLHTFPS